MGTSARSRRVEESCGEIGRRYLRPRAQPLQRSWGRIEPGVLEKQPGARVAGAE
jgi:hypothetical protein